MEEPRLYAIVLAGLISGAILGAALATDNRAQASGRQERLASFLATIRRRHRSQPATYPRGPWLLGGLHDYRHTSTG